MFEKFRIFFERVLNNILGVYTQKQYFELEQYVIALDERLKERILEINKLEKEKENFKKELEKLKLRLARSVKRKKK